jgi:hypothetical protein
MIAPSEFEELSLSGLEPITLAYQEKFNGENTRPSYLFRRFLGKRYSIDGSWQALSADNGLIAADVIALDSSIPLKTRPSVGQVKGELPKLGTERALNESELKQLRLLSRAGGDADLIRSIFFRDVEHCYGGVLEQIEAQFLQGLSTGVILVDEDINVGTGIRVDFQYPAENQFNASVVWGDPGYTPVTDISAMIDEADADFGLALIDRATLNLLLSSDEAKELYANSIGLSSGSFVPTQDQLNAAFESRFGFGFEVVNRSVTYEINGVKQTIKPWAAGQIVFLTNEQVGTLVWTDVEEMNNPVGGVTYSRAEDFILLKQYRLVRPSLKQITASEAVALPVIADVQNIYKLDTTVEATT